MAKKTVLVTRLEYRKAESSFVSASGLDCRPAPDTEADLAASGDARRLFGWDTTAARLMPYDNAAGRYDGSIKIMATMER